MKRLFIWLYRSAPLLLAVALALNLAATLLDAATGEQPAAPPQSVIDRDATARAALALASRPRPVQSVISEPPARVNVVSPRPALASCGCGADCTCGAACRCQAGECGCGLCCADYGTAYRRAVKEAKPLAVFVGGKCLPVAGCVVCCEQPGRFPAGVVVARPAADGDGLDRVADLPPGSDAAAVLAALRPRAVAFAPPPQFFAPPPMMLGGFGGCGSGG